MKLKFVRQVYVKELRSLLRDRHILLYSVALPAFLYPALFLGMFQVLTYVRGVEEKRTSVVEIVEDTRPSGFKDFVTSQQEDPSSGNRRPAVRVERTG